MSPSEPQVFSNGPYRGRIAVHGKLVEVGVLELDLGEDASPRPDDAGVEEVGEGEGISDEVSDLFKVWRGPDLLQQHDVVFRCALQSFGKD